MVSRQSDEDDLHPSVLVVVVVTYISVYISMLNRNVRLITLKPEYMFLCNHNTDIILCKHN